MAPGALRAAVLLLLLGLGVSARAPPDTAEPGLSQAELTQMFEDFVIRFNKTYGSPEERRRRIGIFARAMEDARRLQEAAGGAARFGPTRFSDRTEEEFMGAPRTPLGRRPLTTSLRSPPGKPGAPRSSCDWRKAGAVTRPSNQGTCRSCWAFAAVANVESLWFIHFKMLYNLSVQEVLDCSGFKDACEGGYPWNAFGTIYRLGISTAMSYPYTAQQGMCKWNQDDVVAHIQGFQTLPSNERELAAHVATQGPITVIMNSRLLQHYQGGIITKHLASSCHPDHLDHVVLIVGYGQAKRIPYWIVKNSYGSNWGEKGYFRIYRGGNACGIAEIPITATLGQDGDGDGGTAHPDHCLA